MKLEQQVCSLDLARKLKELGVKQESVFRWWVAVDKQEHLLSEHDALETGIAAFTVAELGEMLPGDVFSQKSVTGQSFRVTYGPGYPDEHYQSADTEANARAKMICYLIEAGIIEPEGKAS